MRSESKLGEGIAGSGASETAAARRSKSLVSPKALQQRRSAVSFSAASFAVGGKAAVGNKAADEQDRGGGGGRVAGGGTARHASFVERQPSTVLRRVRLEFAFSVRHRAWRCMFWFCRAGWLRQEKPRPVSASLYAKRVMHAPQQPRN